MAAHGGTEIRQSCWDTPWTEQRRRVLYACNTYQFSDYSKYESSIFNESEKAAWREEVFPKQCEEARRMGKALVS